MKPRVRRHSPRPPPVAGLQQGGAVVEPPKGRLAPLRGARMGAAPRGGRARRWAARPARPRRRAPAPRSLSAVVLAAARLPRAAFLRLCGRRWVAFGSCPRRPRARSPAAARARRPPASARCGAPVLASLVASGSRSAARGPPRASFAPVARALGGRSCPLRRVPPAARLVLGAGLLAAAPRAGALAPLRGARGASFLAPARSGFGALRRAAPAAAGKHPQGFPVLPGKIKKHQSGKWCEKLLSIFPGECRTMEIARQAISLARKVPRSLGQGYRKSRPLGGSLLILII